MSGAVVERVIRSAYEARGREGLDGVMPHIADDAHSALAGPATRMLGQ